MTAYALTYTCCAPLGQSCPTVCDPMDRAARSPALQTDSLLAEPPGKPKNTGVGSLSLSQGIFPTQEWNWGVLHCRWSLYQLSYPGSPHIHTCVICIVNLSKHQEIVGGEEPGMLPFMKSQRVGHDLATEQQRIYVLKYINY